MNCWCAIFSRPDTVPVASANSIKALYAVFKNAQNAEGKTLFTRGREMQVVARQDQVACCRSDHGHQLLDDRVQPAATDVPCSYRHNKKLKPCSTRWRRQVHIYLF